MLQTVCDRCKKVLSITSTYKKVEIKTHPFPLSITATNKDLCLGCFKELEAFLEGAKK